jgi:hypothetical protein
MWHMWASGSFYRSRQPSLGPVIDQVIAPSQAPNPGFIALARHQAQTKTDMVHVAFANIPFAVPRSKQHSSRLCNSCILRC